MQRYNILPYYLQKIFFPSLLSLPLFIILLFFSNFLTFHTPFFNTYLNTKIRKIEHSLIYNILLISHFAKIKSVIIRIKSVIVGIKSVIIQIKSVIILMVLVPTITILLSNNYKGRKNLKIFPHNLNF